MVADSVHVYDREQLFTDCTIQILFLCLPLQPRMVTDRLCDTGDNADQDDQYEQENDHGSSSFRIFDISQHVYDGGGIRRGRKADGEK